jgi:ribonuclease-3
MKSRNRNEMNMNKTTKTNLSKQKIKSFMLESDSDSESDGNEIEFGIENKNKIEPDLSNQSQTFLMENGIVKTISNNSMELSEQVLGKTVSSDFKESVEPEIVLSPQDVRDRILNENNIPITPEFINGIFRSMGFDHKVKCLENFQQAMIHVSYLEENMSDPKQIKLLKDVQPINPRLRDTCMPLQTKSYERLEFLGDSIIRHGIGKYLYTRYPEKDEGFLTTNRSKMENSGALSQLARRFGMQKYAIIGRNIEQVNGRSTYTKITEDIFEAFMGAVNLEVGDERSVEFVWKIIEEELDMAETIRTETNYKDTLMQYFHKVDSVRRDVQYDDLELNNDGRKRYRTTVREKDTGKKLGWGEGRSKKKSQQRAAKDALIRLGIIGNDKEEEDFFEYTGDIEKEVKNVRERSNHSPPPDNQINNPLSTKPSLTQNIESEEEFFEYVEDIENEVKKTRDTTSQKNSNSSVEMINTTKSRKKTDVNKVSKPSKKMISSNSLKT